MDIETCCREVHEHQRRLLAEAERARLKRSLRRPAGPGAGFKGRRAAALRALARLVEPRPAGGPS